MENMLFIFNIVLTIFFTIASTGFYVLYRKNSKKEFLFIPLLFILMIIENSIVYLSEFSQSFEQLYETSDILYFIIYLTFFGIVFTSRLIVSETFQDKFTNREKQIAIALPLVLGILSFILPFQISELLIYASFYGALAYIALRVYKNIKNTPIEYSEIVMKYYRLFILLAVILCIIGIGESASYFLSYSDALTLETTALSLEYRNIAFDIIKLMICILGMVQLKYSFDNLFDNSDANKPSIDDKLRDFCMTYDLTNRQREIVELVIEGLSNKEIGEKLHIAEGTVKVHVYNVFKKVDITSRNQLIKKIMY